MTPTTPTREELRKKALKLYKDHDHLFGDESDELIIARELLSRLTDEEATVPQAQVYECSACGIAWYEGIQKDCANAKNERSYCRPAPCRPQPIVFDMRPSRCPKGQEES